MSADTPSSSTAVPATEERTAPPPARGGGAGALLTLTLVVALVALLMSGILWQKLEQTQQALARQSAETASDAKDARETATQTESATQELQARLSVAEVRLSEVSLQRTQLEELMISVSRSRDDHLVQELESTLKLAQQQAQLTGSAQLLISALQSADQRIARATQPRLNPVQRAIARDIERIQATSLTDIPALANRLDEMVKAVDDLPLANAVGALGRSGLGGSPSRGVPLPGGVGGQGKTGSDVDAAATSEVSTGLWDRLNEQAQVLWQRIWAEVRDEARDLLRVSRIDQPEALLLAPEQSMMLRQNLKMQLLNARLALLARQIPLAQVDVLATAAAVRRYFDDDAVVTRNMLKALAQIQSEMKSTDLPRPNETLSALAAAAGGR
ncbi:uroporphyrinogen-III C-methyltransferase [Hydrogenophaga sp. OTU3427]|uniref:uroporphyrinogen-III C-methyltransferase n=1 Tax=Hydrogenophaga sp. OTU3427 TaxID=3043856 RepID=UPI00313D8908